MFPFVPGMLIASTSASTKGSTLASTAASAGGETEPLMPVNSGQTGVGPGARDGG